MNLTIVEQKKLLRKEMCAKLAAISEPERHTASLQIITALKQKPLWQNSQTVLFFGSRRDEPDLWPLLVEALAMGKVVALPQYLSATDEYQACRIRQINEDVVTGHYGIREPSPKCDNISLKQLDLVLVPGLGYSRNGGRLGRGKAYYDRLLAQSSGVKCGVGFDCQFGLAVPLEDHDIRLNCIITPSQWLDLNQPGTACE
jgi:5-formyltetrahydrofolate cyclo-ligase